MVKLHAPTQNVLVYGTDGEKALAEGFGRPLHTHCTWCVTYTGRITSLQNLLSWGYQQALLQNIECKFSVKNIGSKQQPGLIDSSSPEEFDEKMQSLTETWTGRHPQGQRFLSYFLNYKLVLLSKQWQLAFHDRTENSCTVSTFRCPIQSLRKVF